jgi:hypothetical protein
MAIIGYFFFGLLFSFGIGIYVGMSRSGQLSDEGEGMIQNEQHN